MVTASANLSTNGRVVLPKKIRDALGIKEGDTLFFEEVSEQEVRMKVLRGEDEFLKSIRNPAKGKGIDPARLKEELWG